MISFMIVSAMGILTLGPLWRQSSKESASSDQSYALQRSV